MSLAICRRRSSDVDGADQQNRIEPALPHVWQTGSDSGSGRSGMINPLNPAWTASFSELALAISEHDAVTEHPDERHVSSGRVSVTIANTSPTRIFFDSAAV